MSWDLIKQKKHLWLFLFAIAFIIRLTLLLILVPAHINMNGIDGYDAFALSLIQQKIYGWSGNFSTHVPAYPIFIALTFLIFGQSYLWVKIAQCVIDSFTCVLVFFIAKHLTKSNLYAIIAGLFSACYLSLIVLCFGLCSESVFTFLLALSILFFLRMETHPNIFNNILAGLTLGLATLTRPATIVFPFFVLIWCIIKYQKPPAIIKTFMIFFLSFAFLLVPWIVRNYSIHKAVVLANTNAGVTFLGANNPWSKGQWVNVWKQKNYPIYSELSEIERNKQYLKDGFDFLKTQTLFENTKLFSLKLWWFFFPLLPLLPKYDLTFAIIFPFCLFGMWKIRKSNNIIFYVIANFILMALAFYGHPRLRSPLSPFIISLGVVGLKHLHQDLKSKPIFIIALGLWIILNISLFLLDVAFNFDFLK